VGGKEVEANEEEGNKEFPNPKEQRDKGKALWGREDLVRESRVWAFQETLSSLTVNAFPRHL